MPGNLDPTTWRQSTSGGIPYRTIATEGSFSEEDASATITFLVPANRILDFALEGFPPHILVGTQLVPQATGSMPGLPQLRAKSFTYKSQMDGLPIDPFGADPDAPDGTYHSVAEVVVTYTTSDFNDEQPEDFVFLEVSSAATGEFIFAESSSSKWVALNGELEDNKGNIPAASAIVPQTEWTIRWPRIPASTFRSVIAIKLRNAMGRVNNSPVFTLYDSPAETLLFVGWGFGQNFTWREGSIEAAPITLELKFLEKFILDQNGRTRGHNDFWRPNVGWQRLLHDGVNPVHPSTDFNSIFSFV